MTSDEEPKIPVTFHPGERVIVSISDEIEEFQRQDINKSLRVGPYDDDDYSPTHLSSAHHSSFTRASEGPHGELQLSTHLAPVSERLNLPVRRLDALDMAKYLSETRARKQSHVSAQAQEMPSPRYRDKEHPVVMRERFDSTPLFPLATSDTRSHWRKHWFAYVVTISTLVSLVIGCTCWAYKSSTAANLSSASVRWHHVAIDQMSPSAFRLAARGELSNTGSTRATVFGGPLRMVFNGTTFGEVTLPNFQTSSQGTRIKINQTVVIKDLDALSDWAQAVSAARTPELLLEGVLKAKKVFRMNVKLDPMRTTLPTFVDRVSAVEPILAALTGAAEKTQRSLTLQMNLTSTLAYDLVFPVVFFDLVSDEGRCARLTQDDALIHAGSVHWKLSGKLATQQCPRLGRQLNERETKMRAELQASSDAGLPYVTSLLRGWRWNVTLTGVAI